MEVVGARLHDKGEHAAADLSVLCGEVACENRDFLKCVHARLHLCLRTRHLTIARVLPEEGWTRHQEEVPVPNWRGRGWSLTRNVSECML